MANQEKRSRDNQEDSPRDSYVATVTRQLEAVEFEEAKIVERRRDLEAKIGHIPPADELEEDGHIYHHLIRLSMKLEDVEVEETDLAAERDRLEHKLARLAPVC